MGLVTIDHIVKKSCTPRFTKSPRLVLIGLVWTEIQPFENVEIGKKCLVVRTPRPVATHFCENFNVSNGCILINIRSIYTKLVDFVNLGVHFLTIRINSC